MNEEKSKMLKLTTDQIETKFGKGSIMKFGEGGHDLNIGVIPTGALPLDAALGIGGVPRGRIVEVYGLNRAARPRSRCRSSRRLRPWAASCLHRRRARARPGLRQALGVDIDSCWSPSRTPVSRVWTLRKRLCARARSTSWLSTRLPR